MTTKYVRSTTLLCGNSSVVEHNLAKVGVASSNLVSRSKFKAFRATEYCYSVCDPKGSRQRGCRLRASFPAPISTFQSNFKSIFYCASDPSRSSVDRNTVMTATNMVPYSDFARQSGFHLILFYIQDYLLFKLRSVVI